MKNYFRKILYALAIFLCTFTAACGGGGEQKSLTDTLLERKSFVLQSTEFNKIMKECVTNDIDLSTIDPKDLPPIVFIPDGLQFDITFTPKDFAVTYQGDTQFTGLWKEVDSHTVEVTVRGTKVVVNVNIQNEDLHFYLINNSANVAAGCSL